MSHLSTRRLIGVIGLALGLLSLVSATVIQWLVQAAAPSSSPIAVAAEQPGVWLTLGVLSVLGPLVWIAAIGPIVALVRGRGSALTTVGGYVTAAGLIAGVGHLALFFGLAADLAGSGLTERQALTVLGADGAAALSNLLLVVFLAGFSLGPILLAVGLRRASLVPVWVPVAAIVATVANFVGGVPAGIVQLLALIATFAPMIALLARRPEDAAIESAAPATSATPIAPARG